MASKKLSHVVPFPQTVRVKTIPSIEELLSDPCTPFWALDVIRVALTKDCVDAAAVLNVLAKVFDARAKQLLGML